MGPKVSEFKFVLLFLFFLPLFTWGDDPKEWILIASAPDYELYRKPSASSSDLVAFRLIGRIQASPIEVATGILDRDHRLQWMRDIRELRTVKIPLPGTVIEYSAVKTPFIIKDRDFVIQTSVEVSADRQTITVVSKSVESESVPETSMVRGKLTEGKFVIEPGKVAGTSQLTADMDVDPRGSVPRWIVNHFQKNWPVGMFRGLKRFLSLKIAKLPDDLSPLFVPSGIAPPTSQKK